MPRLLRCARASRRCGRKSVSNAPPRRAPDPPLPVDREPAFGARVPLLSVLLALCARGGAALRGREGRVARARAGSIRCRRQRAHPAAAIRLMGSNVVNPRLVLWAALALLLFTNYTTWLHDYAPPPAAEAPAAQGLATQRPVAPANDLGSRIPEAPAEKPAGAA